jgi:hypothetical protein
MISDETWDKIGCFYVAFFLGLAFLVALHQYLTYGVWFEVKDLFDGRIHHESFIVAFVSVAVVLFLERLRGKRK